MSTEFFVVNILTVACVIFFAGLVIFSGLSTAVNRRFVYFLIALLGWVALNFISNLTIIFSLDDLLVLNRVLFVVSLLAVTTMLRFCLTIKAESIRKRTDIIIWSLTVIGSLMALSPYVVASVNDLHGPVVGVEFGAGAMLYFLILGALAGGVFTGLVDNAVHATGVARARARSLLLTFGLALVVIAITNAILPLFFDLFYLSAVGSLFVVIMLGGVGYSIIKHQLFDVRLAVVRGATYVLTLLTLAAVYYLTAYALSELFFANEEAYIAQSPLNVGLALLLAFIFQPIRAFFNRITNKVFYRDNYDAEEFFARLSKRLSTTTDLRGLLQRASNEITSTIKVEQGFFAIVYGDNHFMTAGTEGHGRISPSELKEITEYAWENEKTAIITDLLHDENKFRKMLKRKKIALVLPIMKEGHVESCLFMGAQQSRNYTKRDIRTLETIRDELVIAIQNALSVQEVREINATLQQRIEDATKELRQSNTQLQRLDAAKDEFVSMASHQLRTPLTSVKGYISMVLEGDVGRISATQRQLLSEAFASSERMVHLINDFLNVSRLQTGKFMIEQRPIDLAKLVGQEVESLRRTAEAHSLKIQYKQPPYFPVLSIDEGKIRQVVMNFLDNAIYYSREGTAIKVSLRVDGGDALLEVRDTGIGVPKSEQAHLFTKFFRATNARRQRPDGTGVGLFLAKKVIVAHGGNMVFSSVEGEGSTFGFRLPIKKLSAASNPNKLKDEPSEN